MESTIPYICSFIGIVFGFFAGYNCARTSNYTKGYEDGVSTKLHGVNDE